MMLGGVICGYWATGRLSAATAPASVITMDRTDAKIGRSMKKCENIWPSVLGTRWNRSGPLLVVLLFSSLPLSASPLLLVCLHRLGQQPHQVRFGRFGPRLHFHFDLGARPDALHAADNDALPFRQAVLDHPQAFELLTHVDAAVGDLVLVIDDVNVAPSLITQKGLGGNEQRMVRVADGQPDAHEQAGLEESVGVVEDGPHADGAGGGIHAIVDKVHFADMLELVPLVGQAHEHREAQSCKPGTLSLLGRGQ